VAAVTTAVAAVTTAVAAVTTAGAAVTAAAGAAVTAAAGAAVTAAAGAVGVGETTTSNVHFRHHRCSLNNNRPATPKNDGPTPGAVFRSCDRQLARLLRRQRIGVPQQADGGSAERTEYTRVLLRRNTVTDAGRRARAVRIHQKVGSSNLFGRTHIRGAFRHCVSTAHLEPRSRFRGEVDGIGLGEISRSSHRGPLAIFGEEEFVLAYRAFDGVHAER
jgi:hypothetical protein